MLYREVEAAYEPPPPAPVQGAAGDWMIGELEACCAELELEEARNWHLGLKCGDGGAPALTLYHSPTAGDGTGEGCQAVSLGTVKRLSTWEKRAVTTEGTFRLGDAWQGWLVRRRAGPHRNVLSFS